VPKDHAGRPSDADEQHAHDRGSTAGAGACEGGQRDHDRLGEEREADDDVGSRPLAPELARECRDDETARGHDERDGHDDDPERGDRIQRRGDPECGRPEPADERELGQRYSTRRRRGGGGQHRDERPADREDQHGEPAEHGEREVHQEEALVGHPQRLRPSVSERDRSEHESGRGVQPRKGERGPADDEHPAGRRAADEEHQLRQEQREPDGEERRTDRADPPAVGVHGDDQRDASEEQHEHEPAETGSGWIVAEHHRQELPHGRGDGEGEEDEADGVRPGDRISRRELEANQLRHRGEQEERSAEPAGERHQVRGRSEPERCRAPGRCQGELAHGREASHASG